jgi:alpha-1,4-digalacturonate transport system substrate-binding protein
VARVMEFMASEPVLKEYYERTLQIPAHKGLAARGLNYGANVPPQAIAALKAFTENYAKVPDVAHKLQGYERNVAVFNATVNHLSQAITGGLSLAEAYTKIDQEIRQAVGN